MAAADEDVGQVFQRVFNGDRVDRVGDFGSVQPDDRQRFADFPRADALNDDPREGDALVLWCVGFGGESGVRHAEHSKARSPGD